MKRVLAIAILSAAMLAGCAQSPPEADAEGDPRFVGENCGETVTVADVPERVVTTSQEGTELLLALGLEDHIVGIARTYDDFPAEYEAEAATLPDLSGPESITKEPLLAAEPDFVLAVWSLYDFDAGAGAATREEVAAIGATVYGFSANCLEDESEGSIALLFADIRNLGIIFDVEDRAARLIDEMQATLDAVQESLVSAEPIPVLAYANGEGPLGVIGTGYGSSLIEQGGGANVFAQADAGFVRVSVEEAVAASPDVFLVNTYAPGPTADEKVQLLTRLLPTVPASVDGRNFAIADIELNPGVRNAEAVRKIAEALHPELMG